MLNSFYQPRLSITVAKNSTCSSSLKIVTKS
uniref:Uncharacterized protein n=1 Tax=Romanomermis culicivorax TaxID=13658 RepID=A0A915JBP8_ROMCU